MRFKIGNQGGGIGDSLQITPIFKYFTDAIIEIKDNDQGRKIATIYEGMGEIIFKDNPITQEESFILFGDINKHDPLRNGALNYLTIFGIENKVLPIPWIKLTTQEIEWAESFLFQLSKNGKLLSIICSTSGNQTGSTALYRFLEIEKWQEIVNFYSLLGYTVIQFGHINDNFELKKVIPILGLTVRQMAACLKVIGQTITVDTGPYHLSLAVGAKTKCLVPTFSWGVDYYFPNWAYTEEMFEKESLVSYYMFSDYKQLNDEW